jgi:hypothetical protein
LMVQGPRPCRSWFLCGNIGGLRSVSCPLLSDFRFKCQQKNIRNNEFVLDLG